MSSLFPTYRTWMPFVASVMLFAGLTACAQQEAPGCLDEECPVGQACQSGECTALTVPTELGDLGRFTRAETDSDGRLVIATYDTTHGNLVLMRELSDGTINHVLIDGFRVEAHAVVDTDSGLYPSLALGSDDTIHLAWYDADNSELRYARIKEGKPWKAEVVDGSQASDRGKHSSLAVSENGEVAIAYRDETTRGLRYATRGKDGAWASRAISGCSAGDDCSELGSEDYGEYASLVLIAGQARIVFYDRKRGDLKLASQSSEGTFTVTTLDGRDDETGIDSGDVGRFAKVAVDPKRRLAVAYFDATRKSLRYLFEGSGSLVPQVIDFGLVEDPEAGTLRTHVVGQHVALDFDSQGRALLVYLDATALKLKRATIVGEQVVDTSFIDDLPPGCFIDLSITAKGEAKGAYGAWVDGEAPRTELKTFTFTSVVP